MELNPLKIEAKLNDAPPIEILVAVTTPPKYPPPPTASPPVTTRAPVCVEFVLDVFVITTRPLNCPVVAFTVPPDKLTAFCINVEVLRVQVWAVLPLNVDPLNPVPAVCTATVE